MLPVFLQILGRIILNGKVSGSYNRKSNVLVRTEQMKNFDRLIAAAFLCTALCFAGCNLYLHSLFSGDGSREYRVEADRAAADAEEYGWQHVDLSRYPSILGIYPMEEGGDFFRPEQDYMIREIGGTLYRIDYDADASMTSRKGQIAWGVNLILAAIVALVFCVLFFVRYKVLKPFEQLSEVPCALARGNLTVPLREGKNRFFGKFVWGLDLLRENLEQKKQRELTLQREKKTLLLSISHDIKTPLAAIKLYAKALSKGLYPGREREIGDSIDGKADEIENFVSEIIRASHEDFLSLPVNMGECFLSDVLKEIEMYYGDKLPLVKTELSIGNYADCLLKGDRDRLVEVLQNIMENAVKYGDGRWIDISVAREEDCCLISVRNSGCTIAQEELAHIFDSFWRGANAEKIKGSGLGLYICRKLMEKMDGGIYAEAGDGEMCVTVVARKA